MVTLSCEGTPRREDGRCGACIERLGAIGQILAELFDDLQLNPIEDASELWDRVEEALEGLLDIPDTICAADD